MTYEEDLVGHWHIPTRVAGKPFGDDDDDAIAFAVDIFGDDDDDAIAFDDDDDAIAFAHFLLQLQP